MSITASGNARGAMAPGSQIWVSRRMRPQSLSPTSERHARSRRWSMDSLSVVQSMTIAGCFGCGWCRHVRAARRKRVRYAGCHRAQSMYTAMCANSDSGSDVEALRSKIAKLRDETRALEASQALVKEQRRRTMFESSDVDASGGLNKDELRACMNTHFSVDLDEESVAFIFANFDINNNGELDVDEFNGEDIVHALECRRRDNEIQSRQQQQQEDKVAIATSEATQSTSSSSKMWKDVLGEGNQDDGILVRVGCVLAYVLPLCDGISMATPLLLLLPQLLPVALPFMTIDLITQESIPFGQLIWFLVLSYLSRQAWVPSLLRFHLSQAVRFDYRISLLNLFLTLAPQVVGLFIPLQELSINQGLVTEDVSLAGVVLWQAGLVIGVLAFMVLAATVLYSVLCSLAGFVPERVPLLSNEIAGFLGFHRSSSNSEAN